MNEELKNIPSNTEYFDISSFEVISLWNKTVKDKTAKRYPKNEEDVLLITYKPDDTFNKPSVIICPGGGYEHLSVEKEGLKMAEVLRNAGYQPFVLTYRVGKNLYPLAHLDLAMAIYYVRSNAINYGINPNDLMIMGSSAGGHLCASFPLVYKEMEELLHKTFIKNELSNNLSLKPDKIALCYPVISLTKEYHKGSADYLTGGNSDLCHKLSVDLHVNKDYPKTFLWACKDDASVCVSNTIRMAKALKANNIDYKMELFESGGHGCGLAENTSAEGWINDLVEFMNPSK